MSDAVEKIRDWSEQAGNYAGAKWEQLPEIYLYMDQVLTYMNKQFAPFVREEGAGLLTSSMINNYVKDGVLPRPEQKKYAREHLALLTVICMLKQVLSIPDISMLTKELLKGMSGEEMYSLFNREQGKALTDVCNRVEETAGEGESELTRLAIQLSIEANARRTAAERILGEIAASRAKSTEDTKRK